MHQLGILGCGWLGVPLGLHLKTLGYDISGSRRSKGGVSWYYPDLLFVAKKLFGVFNLDVPIRTPSFKVKSALPFN